MHSSEIEIRKCLLTGILLHDKTGSNTRCHAVGIITKNWSFEGVFSAPEIHVFWRQIGLKLKKQERLSWGGIRYKEIQVINETMQCVSKILTPLEKDWNIKIEKKHYRFSFCFCKVNVLLLVITLIYSIKVSIELAVPWKDAYWVSFVSAI